MMEPARGAGAGSAIVMPDGRRDETAGEDTRFELALKLNDLSTGGKS